MRSRGRHRLRLQYSDRGSLLHDGDHSRQLRPGSLRAAGFCFSGGDAPIQRGIWSDACFPGFRVRVGQQMGNP